MTSTLAVRLDRILGGDSIGVGTLLIFDPLGLIACGCILLLGFLLLLVDRARSPLSLPLGLFCLALFGWNFAMVAYKSTGIHAWHWIDNAISPLSAALTLHVVLVFVGARQRLRLLLYGGYGAAALLSAAAVAAFVSPTAQRWIETGSTSVVYLLLIGALSLVEATVLIAHLRRQVEGEERMRTRVMLVALLLGALFFSTDLWNDFIPLPALGQLGALLVSLLLGAVVLRLRQATHGAMLRSVAYAAALGALGVSGYALALRYLATNTAFALLGSVTLTALLALAIVDVVLGRRARAAHERRLLFLGRFSDQLAHDLKNPLAALKNNVEFLTEEHRRGLSLDPHIGFIERIGRQAQRIEQALEGYRRFGREPEREPLELAPLLAELLEGFALEAEERKIVLVSQVPADLGAIAIDRALLLRALDNLLRNAFDAQQAGGQIEVSAAAEADTIVLRVRDEGCGMDAREVAQAADAFFSTKGTSGIGLTFARSVAEAHGGKLDLSSTRGVGTTIEMVLPRGRASERLGSGQGEET